MKTKEYHLNSIDAKKPPYRILSMDGGGIYGLFTAMMLKELCKRDKNFLKNDQITVFAGTSAGALTTLLLAKAENPRDVVLSGELENFFKNELVYSNKLNPVTGALSLFGMSSWSGKADLMKLLDDTFGNKTLGQLKHRVVVTAFDYSGRPGVQFRRWKTRMFYNFPKHGPDNNILIKNVAYGVASLPTLRPILDGIVDGGVFAPDPAVVALAKVIDDLRIGKKLGGLYGKLSILSLGVGSQTPYYQKSNFDFGIMPFSLIPTNPALNHWFPPLIHLLLDPSTENTTYQATQFLGEEFFHRLNPQVIGWPVPPVLPAVHMARFRVWREFIIKQIEYQTRVAKQKEVEESIEATLDWLNSSWNLTFSLSEEGLQKLKTEDGLPDELLARLEKHASLRHGLSEDDFVRELDRTLQTALTLEKLGKFKSIEQWLESKGDDGYARSLLQIWERMTSDERAKIEEHLVGDKKIGLRNTIWRRVERKPKNFKITIGTLLNLRDQGVPKEILTHLASFQDIEYDNKQNFLAFLNREIKKDPDGAYATRVLNEVRNRQEESPWYEAYHYGTTEIFLEDLRKAQIPEVLYKKLAALIDDRIIFRKSVIKQFLINQFLTLKWPEENPPLGIYLAKTLNTLSRRRTPAIGVRPKNFVETPTSLEDGLEKPIVITDKELTNLKTRRLPKPVLTQLSYLKDQSFYRGEFPTAVRVMLGEAKTEQYIGPIQEEVEGEDIVSLEFLSDFLSD